MWAAFLTRFVGCCLLHVEGVDSLHALEEDDHSLWYPRLRHTGEGSKYLTSCDDLAAWFREATTAEFDTKFEACAAHSLGGGVVQRNNETARARTQTIVHSNLPLNPYIIAIHSPSVDYRLDHRRCGFAHFTLIFTNIIHGHVLIIIKPGFIYM